MKQETGMVKGTAAEEPRFSLLEIEAAQAELVAARMDAELIEDPEERASALTAVEQAIAEYSAREVQKVDSYRRLIRALTFALAAAKDERDRQAARASVIQNLIGSIKEAGRRAMEVCGKQRIDGRTGSLILKGNGGVQPLVISNPDLVPASLWTATVKMPMDLYERLAKTYEAESFKLTGREPDNARLRAALDETCHGCSGSGRVISGNVSRMSAAALESGACTEEMTCQLCGGYGKRSVPGAYLGERGNHIEVR